MTMNNSLFSNFAQTATQQGISGEAMVHCNAAEGYIRVKFRWEPPERAEEFTKGLADVLSTVLGMMNVSVKVYHED